MLSPCGITPKLSAGLRILVCFNKQGLENTLPHDILEAMLTDRLQSIAPRMRKRCVGVFIGIGVRQKYWNDDARNLGKYSTDGVSFGLAWLLLDMKSPNLLLVQGLWWRFRFHHMREYRQVLVEASHGQSMERETATSPHCRLCANATRQPDHSMPIRVVLQSLPQPDMWSASRTKSYFPPI